MSHQKRPDYGDAKPEDLARALLRRKTDFKQSDGRSRQKRPTPATPA